MFMLMTLADLRCLREAGVLPNALLDRITALMGEATEDDETRADAPTGTSPIMILQPGDGPSAYALVGLSESTVTPGEDWCFTTDYGAEMHYRYFELLTRGRVYRIIVSQGWPSAGRH